MIILTENVWYLALLFRSLALSSVSIETNCGRVQGKLAVRESHIAKFAECQLAVYEGSKKFSNWRKKNLKQHLQSFNVWGQQFNHHCWYRNAAPATYTAWVYLCISVQLSLLTAD